MKLRSQFVSNSSSTNYVVYLPNDFNIRRYYDEKKFMKIIEREYIEKPSYEGFCEAFDELVSRKLMVEYYDDKYFFVIVDIFKEMGCLIRECDSSSGGDSVIMTVNEEDILEAADNIEKFLIKT